MVKLSRRTAIAGLTALPLVSASAQTADFPDRPLRLVVGFPPGGPNDLLARLIAPGIGERLEFGRDVTKAQFREAQATRKAFRAHLAKLLGTDGVLLLPTVPGPAPLLRKMAAQSSVSVPCASMNAGSAAE